MRRALGETLLDLLQAVGVQGRAAESFRVTGVFLDLPIEVTLRWTGTKVEFLADLPRWRWSTPFDEPRGRLRLDCREGGSA
jgi:hypothetical protein